MSKALRETKWRSRSTACAGQMSPPVQRRTTSSLPVRGLISRTAWLPQAGQSFGKFVGHRGLRPHLADEAEHLRDHVARPLHGHGIADPDVLALDLVLVVERRIRHDDATHRDGSKLGDRSERAGAPDLDLDGLDDRRRLLGRELMRERPARRARHEAEPALQSEVVDLVDHAIDVVAERRALRLDRAIMGQHLLGRAAKPHQLVGRQAEAREGLYHAQLGRGGQRRNFTPGIGEELQRPARGDRRVELAQRARRGVARIGKRAFPARPAAR